MNKVYDEPSPVHDIIVSYVRPGTRVLDVGCATGQLSRRLVEELGCSAVGVEMCAGAAKQAQQWCEKVVVGDISSEGLWSALDGPFDYVLMADVLEHLPSPEKVLRKSLDWLRKDGRAIVAVPNVAHWSIRRNLLLGRWDYEPRGIMDDTHLRFYTRATLARLIEESGYRVESMSAVYLGPGEALVVRFGLPCSRCFLALDSIWIRAFPCPCAHQFIAKCAPAD